MKGSVMLLFMLYKDGGHDLTVEVMPQLLVITGDHLSGPLLSCIPDD